jgi:small subunit ribosomal protein S11
MGKVRIIKKTGSDNAGSGKGASKSTKKKVAAGTLHIEATFNNTKAVLTDKSGNVLLWSSSGSMGFRGAKKGTPFAASKVGDILAEKAEALGLKEINAVIRGVGSGREPVIRSFVAKGYELTGIRDETPIPHNGPKPKKARRV